MSEPAIIDSHIHLTDYESGADIGAIIESACAAGVSHLVCNGTSEHDWQSVLALAGNHQEVIPFLGLHPWFVQKSSADWLAKLEELVASCSCGIGEAGLDKLVEPRDQALQENAFRAQLDLARRYGRPITIHCVRAWGWLMDILRTEESIPRFLVHAYGGPTDLIPELTRFGGYFSFSGKVLDTRFERARKALLKVPSDRLLIETDAPNMLPPLEHCAQTVIASDGSPHNHPANLTLILNGIADLLNESPTRLKARLWENTMEFLSGK